MLQLSCGGTGEESRFCRGTQHRAFLSHVKRGVHTLECSVLGPQDAGTNIQCISALAKTDRSRQSMASGGQLGRRLSGGSLRQSGAPRPGPWTLVRKLQTVLSKSGRACRACRCRCRRCCRSRRRRVVRSLDDSNRREAAPHANAGHHVGRSAPGLFQRGQGEEHSQPAAGHHPCPHRWCRNLKSPVLSNSYVSLRLAMPGRTPTWAPRAPELRPASACTLGAHWVLTRPCGTGFESIIHECPSLSSLSRLAAPSRAILT